MKIFIGYEKKYPEMFEVCRASIRKYNSDIEIIPLIKEGIKEYSRPYEGESTDFAFTRFLVPHLSNYEGISIFCDGDFLWRCNPEELLNYVHRGKAVSVVKHPILVTELHRKMDDKTNRPYPKKYWSSLMVFNNSFCRDLTPEVVNTVKAGWLHRLSWANGISEIPATYNYLVGYYGFANPKVVHFTDGGPWLDEYRNVPFANEWLELYDTLYK
jgi:hypothetical protein